MVDVEVEVVEVVDVEVVEVEVVEVEEVEVVVEVVVWKLACSETGLPIVSVLVVEVPLYAPEPVPDHDTKVYPEFCVALIDT